MTMTATRPRPNGHPGYSETHPRAERTAPLARRLVGTACAAWGLADEVTRSATLVMAELVSNAIRHARGPTIRIIIDRPSDEWVCLAVVDRAPHRLPELLAPSAEEQSGRGLLLIEALSDRWGYDRLGPASRPWGKRCWAELTVSLGVNLTTNRADR
ncbi:ATP-binding protein [Streptomyces sp. MMS24-I2-30]|uniref:ATP-binding protein n=1 Tax=Streptomyces sp. MMS24-I2-30 TaxID=3351564 RepID=UPI003896B53A